MRKNSTFILGCALAIAVGLVNVWVLFGYIDADHQVLYKVLGIPVAVPTDGSSGTVCTDLIGCIGTEFDAAVDAAAVGNSDPTAARYTAASTSSRLPKTAITTRPSGASREYTAGTVGTDR